ncbi:hypothetical protein ACFL1L_04920 [Thermoplasmatota archaeon]
MTLILTEISKFGIAMVADSAVTFADGVTRTLSGVQKLQPIKKINAGISCWGEGTIKKIDTDIWLSEFIRSKRRDYNSINEFALLLQNELRKYIHKIDFTKNDYRWGTIGFHLTGFVEYEGKKVPTFYHIHNGRSQILEGKEIKIDGSIVNANHDMPPSEIQTIIDQEGYYITRNGDIYIYTTIFELLSNFFKSLEENTPIRIPYSYSIEDRIDWLKFQIKMISNLYELSNIGPTIGGNISTLIITQDGIQNYKCINPYFRD